MKDKCQHISWEMFNPQSFAVRGAYVWPVGRASHGLNRHHCPCKLIVHVQNTIEPQRQMVSCKERKTISSKTSMTPLVKLAGEEHMHNIEVPRSRSTHP